MRTEQVLGGDVTTTPPSHNTLLARAARKHLAGIGVQRKGQSRVWYKDHGWWLAVVEFQPSAWSKGSYLNVAAMWLWNAKDYWSFDEGGRVETFHEFKDTDQFSDVAEALATRAQEEVHALLERFPSMAAVASHLRRHSDENPWHTYHAAMASLAVGDVAHAQKRFRALLAVRDSAPFMFALQEKVKKFDECVASGTEPSALVAREIEQARALLKLAPLDNGILVPATR